MKRLIGWILFSKDAGWCDGTCSVSGCSNDCAGQKGHGGPHKCWEH